MTNPMDFYFTSNQDCTWAELGINQRPSELIAAWGARLKKALGPDLLSRNAWLGGELRPPSYRSMVERLDRGPWTMYDLDGRVFYVVPYNTFYDGWKPCPPEHRPRYGFMASAISPYEAAYDLWDDWTKGLSPDLLDNGTFGAWLELLPQPVSVVFEGSMCTLVWGPGEPRVHRSDEMPRYCLGGREREVVVRGPSWRVARAEAYVQAWEKMIAQEPQSYYEDKLDPRSVRAVAG